MIIGIRGVSPDGTIVVNDPTNIRADSCYDLGSMQFRVLLALAATLGVALSAPVDSLKQRDLAVKRVQASPAENTMYSPHQKRANKYLRPLRYYDEDFDESVVKREEASPAENTM